MKAPFLTLAKPRGRFTLIYIILFGLSLVFGYMNTQLVDWNDSLARLGQEIDSEMMALEMIVRTEGIEATAQHCRDLLERNVLGAKDFESNRFYRIESNEGETLFANFPAWDVENIDSRFDDFVKLDDLPRDRGGEFPTWEYFRWRINPDFDLLVRNLELPDGSLLALGRDLNFIEDIRIANAALIGLIVALFAAGGIMGLGMIRSAYQRVDTILSTCHSIINTGNLSKRIESEGGTYDPERLAPALNDMLDRIERSFMAMQLSAANIAHDLKTPLARIRTKVESLQQGQKDELNERAKEILVEIERMQKIFNALIQIALLESGKPLNKKDSVALDDVVSGLVDFYISVFEEKGLILTCDLSPVSIEGDRQLLEQMLSNLLENALKYVPEKGKVHVETYLDRGVVVARVTDSGQGIPDAQKLRVFEKFYRGQSSRSSEGNGLGLSIVKAIADAHGGEVSLSDGDPGLKVTIGFER